MITKFELFKSVNIGEPEIGDYVICEEIGIDQVSNFINNNIGKIVSSRSPSVTLINFYLKEELVFIVEYNLKNCEFYIQDFKFDGEPGRRMAKKEIKYWSKNKEELEEILAAKTYKL